MTLAAADQPNGKRGPTVVVVLGVAGSGKTEVGSLLACALHWQFEDADTYHSRANVAKMSRGRSLTDQDRLPWLELLSKEIDHWVKTGTKTVLACSALKNSYRGVLKHGLSEVVFVYLKGSYETIYARLCGRPGHFMKAEMLAGQFQALEEPEDAIVVDIDWPPPQIVAFIEKELGLAKDS